MYVILICAQRLQTATQLIEKDDAAREILRLQKPMLADFKDIAMKQKLLPKIEESILYRLGLGDEPVEQPADSRPTKRP